MPRQKKQPDAAPELKLEAPKPEPQMFILTEEELFQLYLFHAGRAQYWRDLAEANRMYARQPEKFKGEKFTGDPLNGELATPENWEKRAAIFQERADAQLARAQLIWPKPIA